MKFTKKLTPQERKIKKRMETIIGATGGPKCGYVGSVELTLTVRTGVAGETSPKEITEQLAKRAIDALRGMWIVKLNRAVYEGHGSLSESFEFDPEECQKIQGKGGN